MHSDYQLSSSLISNEHIDDIVNLSCVCGPMNCHCCTTDNRKRHTPATIQEQLHRLTDVYRLKKGGIPHVKICLEERQFAHPSPALRYAKLPRRKLTSAPEPMLFGLPIQYNNDSIDWKEFSIEKLCEEPFTGLSEYSRSFRRYNIDEMQSHRGKAPSKEHHVLVNDLEPMDRFTT